MASNQSRMLKTHCPSGHALEGVNLIIDHHGYRVCRTCKLASTRRWLGAKNEAEKLAHRLRFNQDRNRARRNGQIRHGYTRAGVHTPGSISPTVKDHDGGKYADPTFKIASTLDDRAIEIREKFKGFAGPSSSSA
jgi:hypothetical protein